jgi:hypothetical protein
MALHRRHSVSSTLTIRKTLRLSCTQLLGVAKTIIYITR